MNKLQLMILIGGYLAGLYPAYGAALCQNTENDGRCTRGGHRDAVAQAIVWPSLAGLMLFAVVTVLPLVSLFEWISKVDPFRRIGQWFDDKTPCEESKVAK